MKYNELIEILKDEVSDDMFESLALNMNRVLICV